MKASQLKQMVVVTLALATSAMLGQAAEVTLKVGDPAPKLQVSKWVQGDPVKEFARDKAYIVEFWATWCGPCRVSIPHLNEIHTKFKDKGLIVIGQNVWERDLTKVSPFIEKMGDKMTYRVALDLVPEGEKTGKMAETWMEAAGQEGIPSAFVVDKQGVIVWIGHPSQLKDSFIEQVLAGTFDVKKAEAEQEKKKQSETQLRKAFGQLRAQMQSKEWDKAAATLDEMEKLLPEDERSGLGSMRFQVLLGKADFKGATKLASELSDAQKDNPMLQNQLAWELLTHEGIKERDLDLAAKIATRANDAAKGKDAAILDTLARATFMQGQKDKAIELQEKAVKLAQGDMQETLQETLNAYKKGKLPKAD